MTFPVISTSAKLIITSALVIMIALIICYIPLDMDVFLPFHPLACRLFPLAHLHSFRESCDGNLDLQLAGGLFWRRAQWFQGMAYSIFYYPIYLLLPYWQSAYVLGAFWLLATIAVFARLIGVSLWIALMAMGINFLYAFNLLADICTVGLHTLTVFSIPLLIIKIQQAPQWHGKLAWNIILALLVFLSIEYKFSFVYYIPASCILIWYILPPERIHRKIFIIIKACFPAIVMTLGMLAILCTGIRSSGDEYWHLIEDSHNMYGSYDTLSGYGVHMYFLIERYFLDFINAASIVYINGTWGLDRLLSLVPRPNYLHMLITLPFWIITVGCFVWFYRSIASDEDPLRAAFYRRRVNGILLAGIVTFMFLSTNMHSRHAAHLVPVMGCMLGALALCIDYLYRYRGLKLGCLALALSISQLTCVFYTVRQPIEFGSYSMSRFDVLAYAARPEIASHAVISHLNWGTYYIGSLYGPKDQLVTYNEHYDEMPASEIEDLIKLAHSLNRFLVFIKIGTKPQFPEAIAKALPQLKRIYPKTVTDPYSWQVWAEEDPFATKADQQ